MSEKEERVLKAVLNGIHEMSDFDKGYILAKAEGAAEIAGAQEEKEEKENERKEANV